MSCWGGGGWRRRCANIRKEKLVDTNTTMVSICMLVAVGSVQCSARDGDWKGMSASNNVNIASNKLDTEMALAHSFNVKIGYYLRHLWNCIDFSDNLELTLSYPSIEKLYKRDLFVNCPLRRTIEKQYI